LCIRSDRCSLVPRLRRAIRFTTVFTASFAGHLAVWFLLATIVSPAAGTDPEVDEPACFVTHSGETMRLAIPVVGPSPIDFDMTLVA